MSTTSILANVIESAVELKKKSDAEIIRWGMERGYLDTTRTCTWFKKALLKIGIHIALL